MSKQIKVIEVGKIRLHKNAKYIFLMNPMWVDYYDVVQSELNRLIGEDKFTLLVMRENELKALEILPEDTK